MKTLHPRHRSTIECLEHRIAPALVFGVQTPPLLGQNLIAFDSDAPGTLLLNKAITGLNVNETIEAMDFRPSDSVLFAVTDAERLVTLDTTTGAATLVGSFTLPVATPPGGTQLFDMDFDPVSGNIRALSDWDGNFLINPATGAVIPDAANGTFVAYASGDPNAGKSPYFVTAAGFTNNVPGAINATLFGIDTSVNGGAGVLVRVGATNEEGASKVLNTVGSLNLGGDGINDGYKSGFDIAASGTAFAALNTTLFKSSFYTIDLTTGAATRVGSIGDGVNLTNDISVSPAAFYISSPSVTEGDSGTKTLTFTVTLSESLGSTATVQYATADGTATTGNSDYVTKSGTLTFNAGVRTQTIDVTINGDAANEGNETFFVNLSIPTNASLAIRQGTGTIQNDDGAATISINDRSVNEGASGATTNATFDITLSAPSSQTITVNYATANGTTAGHIARISDNDYTAASGTVTFAPGETMKTIDVVVKDDSTPENNETFDVILTLLSDPSQATIADGQGLGTILNDDLVFSIGNAPTAAEGNSGTHNATFTVTLTGENNLPVQVSYTTQDGTATTAFGSDPDYVTKSGVVVFTPATHGTELTSMQTFDVLVNGDLVGEPDETFTVVLSTPTANSIIGAGQGTGSHTITNDDVPFVPITDFDPSSPAFNGGVFVATGDVDGDGHPDIITGADAGGQTRVKVFSGNGGAQLFSFLAGDSSNTTGVRVAAGDVNGDGKADIITAFGPGGPHDVKVFSGADASLIRTFFPFPGALAPDGLFVAAGDMNNDGKADIILGSDAGGRPLVAVVNGDTGAQMKLFSPFATDFTGGVRVAAGKVNADQIADIIVSTGPGSAPLVKVYDGTAGTELLYSFAPYDAAFTGGVFVGAGDVNGDGRADIITGPGAGGARPVEIFSGANGALIDALTPYEANYAGGVHVAGGLITQDAFAEIVTGSGTGRAPLVKIFDRHTIPPGAQLFIGNATIDEGTDIARSITLQVAINAAHAGTVTVDFTTADGSATAGFDFTATSGTLSFAPNEFVKTITVPIVADGNAEPDEIFTVNLSNASSGAAIFNGTGIATLRNDDLPARSLILAQSYLGSGVSIAAGDINGDGVSDTVIGPEFGAAPLVSVYTRPDSPAFNAFFAYDSSFTGGLSVAIGDVNGDGTGDVIVGPGSFGRNVGMVDPLPVKVFDGTTLGNPSPTVLMSLFPFGQNPREGFLPISVAAGDVDGDGKADIIVGRTDQVAAVKVFSGADAHEMRSFAQADLDLGTIQTFPIPDNPRTQGNESQPAQTLTYSLSSLTVKVAAGDVNGDGKADIIVGFGVDEPGTALRINPATANPKTVNVFSGATGDASAFTRLSSFVAFADSSGAPPSVAAGDLDGDGKAEVVAGSPPVFAVPQVKFFNGLTGAQIAPGQLGQPALSERAVPAPDPNALVVYDVKFRGGVNVALADMTGDGIPDLITAPGPSKAKGVAEIKFLDVASPLSRSFFDPATLPTTGLGTVRVALGDVTGDGIADIVRTGTKTATVSVFDGATGNLLRTLAPFGGKVKGAYVAVGDTNFDGIGDIVVGSPKKPQVQIYSGVDGALLQDFTPGDVKEFKGGVSVASADYNGDGRADVLIGSLTKPHFILVRGNTPTEQILLRGDAGLKGGINVAMANVDGIGSPELIFSAVKWAKGLPRVEVRDSGGVFDVGGTAFQFTPFGETYRGRISLAAGDVNGDGKADIIVATGRGPATEVKVISGATGGIIGDYFPFGATNKLGTIIAAGDLNGDGSADLLGITTIAKLVTTKIIPGVAGA